MENTKHQILKVIVALVTLAVVVPAWVWFVALCVRIAQAWGWLP